MIYIQIKLLLYDINIILYYKLILLDISILFIKN